MIKCYLPLLLFFFASIVESSAQGWQWAAGGTGGSEGYGIAVDLWGNTYATGYGTNTQRFGGITLSNLGAAGTIMVRYDGDGNLLWAKSTHNGFAKPINIATDIEGNLYLYGFYTSPTLTIDSIVLVNPGVPSELFMLKYSPTGRLLFAKNLCPGKAGGNMVVREPYVYMTATFADSVVHIGAFTFYNAGTSVLTNDIIYIKTDTSGNVVDASAYGGTGNEIAYIAVTPSGSSYLSGTTTSHSLSFGPISFTITDTCLFIVRYDSAGNAIWGKTQYGIGKIGSFVAGIATDSAENAFVTGSWRQAAFFGSRTLTADTISSIFLVRYDSSAIIKWVAEVKGNGQLGGSGVATDNCGNVWICGGMGDQQPGHSGSNYIKVAGIKIDTPRGSRDPMFIAEWNTNGTYLKSALLPTGGDDMCSIGTDPLGNVYISGDYWLGPYTIGGRSLYDPIQPSEDLFVVKYFNSPLDTIKSDTTICFSDSAVLRAPRGMLNYRWENGSRDSVRTVYAAGSYKLYGSGSCGGKWYLQVFDISYGQFDTIATHIDTSICIDSRAVLISRSDHEPYIWSDGTISRSDTINSAGTYVVTSKGSCVIPTIIDTFFVTPNNLNINFSLGNDTDVCGPILLHVPVAGASAIWQDGSTGIDYLASGSRVYFAAISVNNCLASDTIAVQYIDLTQHLGDTTACSDKLVSIIFKAKTMPGASVLWSTGSTNPYILVQKEGTYWVTVTDGACIGTDTMNLELVRCECDALFPAAFTPNDDGNNDYFGPIIDKNCNVQHYTFCVYNRWGNLIFMTHNPAERWSGKFKDTPQDSGIYMYYVQYSVDNVFNQHLQKGDVLLVR